MAIDKDGTYTLADVDFFVNANDSIDDGLTAIVEKRHDARTADMRVIAERRRKPRQTREQFFAHVAEYCARKKK